MAERQLPTARTRMRIISAARDLLSNSRGISGFTIDAVAERARVARMTVYYQFESKRGLVEALFEDVARRGGLARVKDAFREQDPHDALREFVFRLVYFWAADRLIIRRLRGLGALDPEIGEDLRARDDRRRHGLSLIAARMFQKDNRDNQEQLEELIEMLQMLTSFETYDQLAGKTHSAESVAATLWRTVGRIIERNPR